MRWFLTFPFSIFQGALFESNHYDENDVQTISNRCDVQTFGKYLQPNQDHDTDNDKYYLAGTHNAIEKTVQFATGVLSCDWKKRKLMYIRAKKKKSSLYIFAAPQLEIF